MTRTKNGAVLDDPPPAGALAALAAVTLGGVGAVLPRMRRDVAQEGALSPSTAAAMYGAYAAYTVLFGGALRHGRPGAVPTPVRHLARAAAAAGGALVAAGMRQFGSARQVSGLGEDELVTGGVYRWTRNPQYLGVSLALAGLAVARGSVPGLATAATYPVVTDRWIRVEESHLADRFGAAYHAWCERTPRWFRAPG